jgi:broad specificity phosphatase PhoE
VSELILVRHGETALNAARKFQGHSSVSLSERGREQAREAARALEAERITHVFSSDLPRALQTAQIVAAPHGRPIVTDTRLREFDFGAWEGLSWSEILERWPEVGAHAPTQARYYAPHGGESFDDVVARVQSFFDDVESTLEDDARVLIVAHAGTLHAALAVLRPPGIDPVTMSFTNGSVTRIPRPQ